MFKISNKSLNFFKKLISIFNSRKLIGPFANADWGRFIKILTRSLRIDQKTRLKRLIELKSLFYLVSNTEIHVVIPKCRIVATVVCYRPQVWITLFTKNRNLQLLKKIFKPLTQVTVRREITSLWKRMFRRL